MTLLAVSGLLVFGTTMKVFVSGIDEAGTVATTETAPPDSE